MNGCAANWDVLPSVLLSPWCTECPYTSGHTAPPSVTHGCCQDRASAELSLQAEAQPSWRKHDCRQRSAAREPRAPDALDQQSTERDAAFGGPGPSLPRSAVPAPPHLCLLEQLDDESQPVGEQLLQLQADDGQRQHGALELQQLVTGHAVQQLLGERHHVLRGTQLGQDGQ